MPADFPMDVTEGKSLAIVGVCIPRRMPSSTVTALAAQKKWPLLPIVPVPLVPNDLST